FWPSIIAFCCVKPAEEGGNTPLTDSREVYQLVPEEIRSDFVQKGVLYVRNYKPGLGLSWQEVFRSDDKAVVEETCRNEGIECLWTTEGILSTRCKRPAVVRHPRENSLTWFNQLLHWHPACLDPDTRRQLTYSFGEENLPR